MKITNGITMIGSVRRMMKALGTAPIKGPKNGITFVMPTKTLMRQRKWLAKHMITARRKTLHLLPK